MIVVFDLDDTLYPELTFVNSGFHAVSDYLATQYHLSSHELFVEMIDILEREGRGKIFDQLLLQYGIYSQTNTKKCINIYRHHHPQIELYPDAIPCLEMLDSPQYIVTDGHKIVQKNKIDALQISPYFKKIYLTHRFGIKYEKPSTYCFQKICSEERCSWDEVVYVGDNPLKDFIGLNRLNANTVRIHRGSYKDMVVDEQHDAQHHISTLSELPKILGDLKNV